MAGPPPVPPPELRQGVACRMPDGAEVMARRGTLDIAPLFAVRLRAAAPGYFVALGGSVLLAGRGRDFDFALIRQAEYALPPERLQRKLAEHLGEPVVPWAREGNVFGAVYQSDGWLLDVAVFGWAADSLDTRWSW